MALGWEVVGTSVVGASHVVEQRCCEDSSGLLVVNGRLCVLAAADGAGSAALADVASKLAVDVAMREMANRLARCVSHSMGALGEMLPIVFRRVAETLSTEAEMRRVRLQDLSTTLLVAVATDDFCLGAQIGDGAICFRDAAGKWRLLTLPMQGEYANETVFVDRASTGRLRPVLVEVEVSGLAAITDGLQRAALEHSAPGSWAPVQGFFEPLHQGLLTRNSFGVELTHWLRNSATLRRKTSDDLSIVMASRRSPAAKAFPEAAHSNSRSCI